MIGGGFTVLDWDKGPDPLSLRPGPLSHPQHNKDLCYSKVVYQWKDLDIGATPRMRSVKSEYMGGYKTIFSKKSSLLFMVIFLFVLLAGCGRAEVVEDAEQYISTVDQIDIPDQVKIVGLGEATHGNIEFQELKKDVFAGLVKNENFRVFVLEGDFGAGQRINQFILNGNDTAEEAVNALDYGIYKTEQMMELVQWMHDYNATVERGREGLFLWK